MHKAPGRFFGPRADDLENPISSCLSTWEEKCQSLDRPSSFPCWSRSYSSGSLSLEYCGALRAGLRAGVANQPSISRASLKSPLIFLYGRYCLPLTSSLACLLNGFPPQFSHLPAACSSSAGSSVETYEAINNRGKNSNPWPLLGQEASEEA